MPWPTQPDPDAGHLAQLRTAGASAAERMQAEQAPSDPIDAVAWSAGVGSFDAVQGAVDRARAAGFTWKQIGLALGQNEATARHKYSPKGYEAQRRYRQRKSTSED